MDLQDQLKNLFPNHESSNEVEEYAAEPKELLIQKEPMICKYEKRKGKATTIIEGYEGNDEDFKTLAKEIKTNTWIIDTDNFFGFIKVATKIAQEIS